MSEGAELPDDMTAGDSMLDSVFGLSAAGDCTSLLVKRRFPVACTKALVGKSCEIEDRMEDVVDGTWLSIGVEGSSSG